MELLTKKNILETDNFQDYHRYGLPGNEPQLHVKASLNTLDEAHIRAKENNPNFIYMGTYPRLIMVHLDSNGYGGMLIAILLKGPNEALQKEIPNIKIDSFSSVGGLVTTNYGKRFPKKSLEALASLMNERDELKIIPMQ